MTGYAKATEVKPAYAFRTGSDDQIKPGEFWKLWKQREQAPFMLGVRAARADPSHRLVVTHIL
jgi:hypothetical protein